MLDLSTRAAPPSALHVGVLPVNLEIRAALAQIGLRRAPAVPSPGPCAGRTAVVAIA